MSWIRRSLKATASLVFIFNLAVCSPTGQNEESGDGLPIEEGLTGRDSVSEALIRFDTVIGPMGFSADLEVLPDSAEVFSVSVRMTNLADTAITLRASGCRWAELQTGRSSTAAPVWQESELPAVIDDNWRTCFGWPDGRILPGKAWNERLRYSAQHILGDSLEVGRYQLSVIVTLDQPPIDDVKLDLGSIHLVRTP